MMDLHTSAGQLRRRFSSSELIVAALGVGALQDPLGIVLVAGGYALARSLRKMHRPALGASGFVTTELVLTLAAVARLVHLGAPQAYMGALLGIFCLGRGLTKKLAPRPQAQHLHI